MQIALHNRQSARTLLFAGHQSNSLGLPLTPTQLFNLSRVRVFPTCLYRKSGLVSYIEPSPSLALRALDTLISSCSCMDECLISEISSLSSNPRIYMPSVEQAELFLLLQKISSMSIDDNSPLKELSSIDTILSYSLGTVIFLNSKK